MIPGATGLTYSPGTVTQQTCYIRCARRAGCPSFVESNIVTLSISSNCGGGGGGNPDCNNITITTQPGKIVVAGLDGAPITSVQIFSSSWQPEHNCFANCSSPTATYTVPAGAHYVYVKYYTAGYQLICEKNLSVNVPSALDASQSESFEFAAEKQLEHSVLYWIHNGGYHVTDYILERSLDGLAFEEISSSRSLGSASPELYEGFDLKPATGDNFYRVKMLDTDGTIDYSEVKLINFEKVQDFILFPNPANSFVNMDLESVLGQEGLTITLFNNLGLEGRYAVE